MSYTSHELRGFGGWLAFFVISIGVFSPLALVFSLLGNLYGNAARSAAFFGSAWVPLQIAEWMLTAASIAGCLYIAWRLLNVETWVSVRIAIFGIWTLGVGLPVIETIVIGLTGRVSAEILGGILGSEIVRPVLGCALWTAYLLRSRRVANTYAGYGSDQDVTEVFG